MLALSSTAKYNLITPVDYRLSKTLFKVQCKMQLNQYFIFRPVDLDPDKKNFSISRVVKSVFHFDISYLNY